MHMCVSICVCHVCVYVCVCTWGQMRRMDLLELELQEAVKYMKWVPKPTNLNPTEEWQTLLTSEPSLQPPNAVYWRGEAACSIFRHQWATTGYNHSEWFPISNSNKALKSLKFLCFAKISMPLFLRLIYNLLLTFFLLDIFYC